MISLLLILLLAPFTSAGGESRPAVRPVVCPYVIGDTVATAIPKLTEKGIDLKIKDPILGLRDPDPGGADDGETIVNQFPKVGHAPYNDPVTGYYVAVILDPGGENGTSTGILGWAVWLNLLIGLTILWRTWKRPVNPKGPDPVPYRQ